MNKLLTEQKVLKKLGIEDFRHLTKAKVITLASMIDKMDPEVAKKALEQFPEFAKTISEMLKEYKQILDKALDSNSESMKSYYDICNSIIESLKEELKDQELSFEERKYIIEQMKDVANMVGEKDTENKRFLASLSIIGGVVVAAIAGAVAAALGGKTSLETDDSGGNSLIEY